MAFPCSFPLRLLAAVAADQRDHTLQRLSVFFWLYQQVGELTPMSSGRTPTSAGKAGVDSLAPLPGKFSSKSVSTKRSGTLHG
jgi:hypothetical protein